MKDETEQWLAYADENLRSARLLLQDHLLNPTLQNAQQAAEKAIKAILIERGAAIRKTHSIGELAGFLREFKVDLQISDEECELLDSIYLPSKYPLGSALPRFDPTPAFRLVIIGIADRISRDVCAQSR